MTRTLSAKLAAATILAAAVGFGGVAVARQDSPDSKKQQKSHENDDRGEVRIKRSSTWGLSEEVRYALSDAYEKMYSDPEKAIDKLKFATNLTEILAAAAPEGEARQGMERAADDLGTFARGVERRQITNPDDLGKPGAAVTFAIARAQYVDAKRGMERDGEERLAYSLDSAAANLLQTHIYLKNTPSESVAKAAYDAAHLGAQLKSLVEPTTQEDSNGDKPLDTVQLAGGEQKADGLSARLSAAIPQVMKQLGDALDETAKAVKQATDKE